MKGTEKCAIKWKLKFEDYRLCLEATQFENKINQPKINKLVEKRQEFIKTINKC